MKTIGCVAILLILTNNNKINDILETVKYETLTQLNE